MRTILLFFVFIVISGSLYAQNADGGTKWIFYLDFRSAITKDQGSITIGGFRTGVEFKKLNRIGIGFYFLSEDLQLRVKPDAMLNKDSIIARDADFKSITLFYERVIYLRNRWEFSIPFQLGLAQTKSLITFQDRLAIKRHYIPYIEPSINGHYKIFNWIGIGTGLGFRYAINSNDFAGTQKTLSGPFYILKVKLFLGPLIKDLQGPHRLKRLFSKP